MVAIVSHDAGGAEILSSWVKKQKEEINNYNNLKYFVFSAKPKYSKLKTTIWKCLDPIDPDCKRIIMGQVEEYYKDNGCRCDKYEFTPWNTNETRTRINRYGVRVCYLCKYACCPKAVNSYCVCLQSTSCTEHGIICNGTHD